MSSNVRSPIQYAGGKSTVADFLVGIMPPHRLYVDMFCGGMSVSLAKPPAMSEAEWFNDKYDVLVNFFRVIKERPESFIDYFRDEYVIDSEVEYRRYTEMLRDRAGQVEMPNVELAVAFWMTQAQTFTGRNAVAGTSFRYAAKRMGKRHYLDLDRELIRALHDRLRGVQIFSRDFRHIFEMVERSSEDSVFIFEDPPYWNVAGSTDYACRFEWQDHVDLAEWNKKTKARWLLTINDHDDIRGLYDGWAYLRPYSFMYKVVKEERSELLISNYDTAAQLGPLFQFTGV